ncbi:uncharacterized protein [Engystomops pustulosus]|uniref:uncharacterized protein n=1 Tax=Engystomops pustulosus TaxID=76066 RepID=UPI003AFB2E4F
MAYAVLRKELDCSICLKLYTDPVTLRCGHNFCWFCTEQLLNTQDESGVYSCPECREEFQERPILKRNIVLCNIAENILSTHQKSVDPHGPAANSSLMVNNQPHLDNTADEHALTKCRTSTRNRKCSIHKEFLNYYCYEDVACICMTCYYEEHRGHQIEVMDEASEKKKKVLIKSLQKLISWEDETKERQTLKGSKRKLVKKAARETESITALFMDLRKRLDDLEKRILSDISRQEKKISNSLSNDIRILEIMKDELSRKMRDIVNLCNVTDPLTVLHHTCDLEEEGSEEDTGHMNDTAVEGREENTWVVSDPEEDGGEEDTGHMNDTAVEGREENTWVVSDPEEDGGEEDTGHMNDTAVEGREENTWVVSDPEEDGGGDENTGDLTDPEGGGHEEIGDISDPEEQGHDEDTGDISDPEEQGHNENVDDVSDPVEVGGEELNTGHMNDPEEQGHGEDTGVISDLEEQAHDEDTGDISDPEEQGHDEDTGDISDPEEQGDDENVDDMRDPVEVGGEEENTGHMNDPEEQGHDEDTGDISDPEEQGDDEDTGDISDPEEQGDDENVDDMRDPVEVGGEEENTGHMNDPEEQGHDEDTGDISDPEEQGDDEDTGNISDPEEQGHDEDTGDISDPEEQAHDEDTGDISDPEEQGDDENVDDMRDPVEVGGEEENTGHMNDPEEQGHDEDTGDISDPEEQGHDEDTGDISDPEEQGDGEDTGDISDPEEQGDDEDWSVELISHISHTLSDLVRNVVFCGQDPADILLDINTAGNYILISDDLKTATWTHMDQSRPETAERFRLRQVMSSRGFTSGRHYWDVEISGSLWWRVGVCYPSIDRRGSGSYIGDNNKSWGLYGRQGNNNHCSVIYDSQEIYLPHKILADKVRIYVDYEAGELSFYELCDPIRHLHTFTTTFTEPLHATLSVWEGYVKIGGGEAALKNHHW